MCQSWHPHKSNLDIALKGLGHDDIQDATKCVYTRRYEEFEYGQPIAQPIVHSSGYRLNTVQQYNEVLEKQGDHAYSRFTSPTSESVEAAVNLLEQGAGCLTFSSGTGAIATAFLGFLKAGDNLMICNPVQNCTLEILQHVLVPLGVDITQVPGGDPEGFRAALKPNTKAMFIETPGNPLISIIDLKKFGELSVSLRERGVVSMVDGTFASPLLQKPLQYGVDLSIHSATKFLSGHGDLCAGVVTCRTTELWRKLLTARATYGSVLSPFDSSLLLRGIRSLHVRVPQQARNALAIAEFLEPHPLVEWVYYAGLKSHPMHEVAMAQMNQSGGGMLCALLKGGRETVVKFFESLQILNRGVSLGNCETLIDYPCCMSHGGHMRSEEERSVWHIQEGHIRICCGLEDPEDLIADIRQALENAFTKEFTDINGNEILTNDKKRMHASD